MATQSGQSELHMPELRQVMSRFKRETLQQIQQGFNIQPLPLWPNERISRRDPTGRGIAEMDLQQFGGNDPNEAGFVFTIPEHMRWAELGVMRGLPSSRVQRGRKGRSDKRYVRRYNPLTGDTHRPTFSPELRHLSRRYGTFIRDFYGEEMMVKMFDAFGAEMEEVDMGF